MILNWIKKSFSSDDSKKKNQKNKKTGKPQNTTDKPARKKPKKKTSARKKVAAKAPAVKWDISEFQVPQKEGKIRFHDLDLPESLMHAIYDLGFLYCSPIQEKVLPHTLRGHDAIGKAQTGTGKTAAFLITIIDELINNPFDGNRPLREPRAVVVAPTRELVMQIADDAEKLCKYTGLNIMTFVGGMPYKKQLNALATKPADIVVATPGRLNDFIGRKEVSLSQVEFLVLDEADRMLDMGFMPQVKRIVRATPPKDDRQTLLFSATFPYDIMNLSEQWTVDPVHVEIAPENVATTTIEQKVYLVADQEKLTILMNLLKSPEVDLVIVFANRRDQVQYLYRKINQQGINVGLLSGEISQSNRTKTLDAFKNGKIKAVVATDLMGRGIHIDGITHVINYNLPEDPEDYVHRIGRTGRAGKTGISISLVCGEDAFQMPAIEEYLGHPLACENAPDELRV